MGASNYALLSAFIFTLVAVLQLVRAIKGWPVTIGTNFNSSMGELGCLRCCRRPCLARIRSVSSLRNRVSARVPACLRPHRDSPDAPARPPRMDRPEATSVTTFPGHRREASTSSIVSNKDGVAGFAASARFAWQCRGPPTHPSQGSSRKMGSIMGGLGDYTFYVYRSRH